jgi:hypothetical protein
MRVRHSQVEVMADREATVLERKEVGEIVAVVAGEIQTVVDKVGAGVIETEIGAKVAAGLEGEIFRAIDGEVEAEAGEAGVEVQVMAEEAGMEAEIKEEEEDMADATTQEKIPRLKSCSNRAETLPVSFVLRISPRHRQSDATVAGINFDHYDDIPVEVTFHKCWRMALHKCTGCCR